MNRDNAAFEIANSELQATYDDKYPTTKELGWGPVLRRRYGYITPDEYYETVVDKVITENCSWADIGCGRDIFPSNRALEATLAARARRILGIDPDANIDQNPYITEAFRGFIDDYDGAGNYDVVTMRMVAEHVENPSKAIAGMRRILRPGGKVVIYTPHKWAPLSIIARWTPLWFHHRVKKFFWGTEAQDTFPVAGKMNTKNALLNLFIEAEMDCLYYKILPDCRIFSRFRWLNRIELMLWRFCRVTGLPYPESCILAVFERR